MMNRNRLSALSILCLLTAILVGCTALLPDSDSDLLGVAKLIPLDTEVAVSAPMSIGDRVAYRIALDSSYYAEISQEIPADSQASVERINSKHTLVVFSQQPSDELLGQEGMIVYPYVMFIISTATREIVEVARVTPNVTDKTLLVESITREQSYTQAMSECGSARLDEAKRRLALRGPRLNPNDYLCDPDVTSSYVLCWNELIAEGYTDQNCLQLCQIPCGLLSWPYDEACELACYWPCWQPPIWLRMCVTIYPCNQPT